jgi:transposase-like protein
LSTGDFEPAFRELLGAKAPLSASTIVRLKATWADGYAAWRRRPISARYAYVYGDGIYLGVGLEDEHSCLLVVIGARENGAKELLAIGDGALGLWAALREVFPATRHQRCWNHYADLRIMPTRAAEPVAA